MINCGIVWNQPSIKQNSVFYVDCFLSISWLLFDYYFPKTGKTVGVQVYQGLPRFSQMGAEFVGYT